jgi:hypothetical protein
MRVGSSQHDQTIREVAIESEDEEQLVRQASIKPGLPHFAVAEIRLEGS